MNAIKSSFPRRAFATSDGVRLSYIRQGSGRPLVLLHGWSQCAEEFNHQTEPLSARYDVVVPDQRSHGESQKVPYGLKISRLAKDLYDLLTELALNEVAVLGHSMGSAVIWSYLDLFGPERLSKIVLVDQPSMVTSHPHWTPQELEAAGAFLTAQQVSDIVAALRGEEAEQVTRQLMDGMVTRQATSEVREWIIQCNLKMPRPLAGTLLYNLCHTDWRDVIPRIDLPALIISGRASSTPWKSQEWIHRQIKGSQFEVFEESEGVQHFMFIENPEKFNGLIMEYLG
ncbi:MAG: alpha/beta hydrolase [Verrucomicrobia bacterium]|nr:alpha/beta hydrolase [Verrucomicrobiota bacterium]